MKMIKALKVSALVLLILGTTSCSKEYDNGEVIENSYTGNVNVTSGGSDPAGDFTGNGDSGTYSFAWQCNQNKASLNFDITTPTGSCQFILEDADGTEVLNKTRSAGGNDSYSGVSSAGTPGIWTVKMILTDFNGDGSYSLHPGD